MVKKLLSILLCFLLAAPDLRAAFNAATVFEVRATGAATNGGCFVTGASGTDHSQQDAAWESYTDLVIGAVTTELTSAAFPFAADDEGNCINIASGAGCTVQIVQVVSVAAAVATIDKSAGTTASTCTGVLGGALIEPNNVKSSTYTRTTTHLALTIPGTAALPIKWIGYQTTRGDDTGTMPILTSATNDIALVTLNAASYNWFENIKFTHTAATRGIAFSFVTADSDYFRCVNCVADGVLNFISYGTFADDLLISRSTILNTTGHAITGATINGFSLDRSAIYNTGAGAGTFDGVRTTGSSDVNISASIIALSSGRGLDLENAGSNAVVIDHSAIIDNVSDGIGTNDNGTDTAFSILFRNNVLWSNGGYGFNPYNAGATTAYLNSVVVANYGNAYGDNTSGARNKLSAGQGDVAITGNPFIDCDATLDCDLNNTAGAGADLRAAGLPGVVGATGTTATTGFLDIGVSQHEDAGATTVIAPGGSQIGY